MKYSIIVPIHALNDHLKRCIDSLVTVVSKEDTQFLEIILVLDGIEFDKLFFDQWDISLFSINVLSENKGPAYCRNYGAKVSSGEVLFFIDSDVEIHPDTIQKVRKHFEWGSSTDAVIGSYDDTPADKALLSKYRNLLHHYMHQQADESASTFWGACGAIRKDAFLKVAGFNTDYRKPSIEDIDLGYRLLNSGVNIKLDKYILVKHLKKWSFANMVKTDVFYRARPWTFLLHKYNRLDHQHLNISGKERLAAGSVFLTLLSLLLSFINAYFLGIAFLMCVGVLFINRGVYLFFIQYVPVLYLPVIIVLHWGYLICALIGFVLGSVDYLKKKALNQI